MHPSDNDWPVVVDAIKSEPTMDISQLGPQQKQQLWRGMKQVNPSLAEMLSNDRVIANIKASFQANIVLPTIDANNYLKAGETQQDNG